MAHLTKRLPQNAAGEFYVDSTCIDCGICRWVAPESFGRSCESGLSYVRRQPSSPDATVRAFMALAACPTHSIGTESRLNAKEGVRRFPMPLDDGVYFCGFASPASYGACSYLIRRPGGNVLVDSPRAAEPLMKRIAELGGIELMFLTHKDDVADHRRFRGRFGCDRVLHRRDVTRDTSNVERQPEGDDPISLDEDLIAIPVPGHTAGSMALLFRERFLFTGDHLWWDGEKSRLGASRSVCWHSWKEQIRSMEKLRSIRFEWVLPGHGDPCRAPSVAAMQSELERLVGRMQHTAA